jgi:hypothetical protein
LRCFVIDAPWPPVANPDPLLRQLSARLGPRRLRLFGAACCRRIGRQLPPGSLAVVQLAERYADGLAPSSTFEAARAAGAKGIYKAGDACLAAWHTVATDPFVAARDAAWYAASAVVGRAAPRSAWDTERAAQVELLRDMAGSTFSDMPGLTEFPLRVREAAEQLYYGNALAALELAVCLREAGHEDLARHFEAPQITHPRGCWVLDWVRGRISSTNAAI